MWSDIFLILLVFLVVVLVASIQCIPQLMTECSHKWSAYTEPEMINGSLVQQRKCSKCNIVDSHIEGKSLEKRDG